MQPYQKFPISNYRIGLDEAVEPWLLPGDAYQSIINAHLYRGVLEKIDGYSVFARFGYRNVLALTLVSGNTWSGTLTSAPTSTNFYGYGTIVAGTSAEIFTYANDASPTLINLVGTAGGTGTVNLTTLVVTLIFNSPVPAGMYSSVFFIWDSAPTSITAIMGIKPYFASNGSQQIIVFDQLRMGKVVNNVGTIASADEAIYAISEIPHSYYQSMVIVGDGMTVTFTGTFTPGNIVPGTITFFQFLASGAPVNNVFDGETYGSNVQDTGLGGFEPTMRSNVAITSGSVNYTTGAWTITFTTPPPSGNYFDSTAGIYGQVFTGSISNFFTVANYEFYLFFTNGVDRIMYYDGDTIQFLNTNLQAAPVLSASGEPSYDIRFCLHLTVNRARLLLLRPFVDSILETAAIFWSRPFNPLDFTNDEQAYADTSESIVAFSYINSNLIVRFSQSERQFTYTQDEVTPFRWDTINTVWACDAPYSPINYDKRFTSVGKPAIVTSDAIIVKRADDIIPDFTNAYRVPEMTPAPFMSQNSIRQCYGQRFDDLKEGWLCYNSGPQAQAVVTASDNVLAYNYIDNTYAIYSFPFSCLGLGQNTNVETWGTTTIPWDQDSDTWGDYDAQTNALIDLGGDQYDTIFQLNSANTRTVVDDPMQTPYPVLMDVITKNFNPFLDDGQLCRFGYLDLLVSANADSTMRVQFFVNDQLYMALGEIEGFYQENILTFKPNDAMSPVTDQIKVWKRIYVGAVGKVHTIRFYQNIDDFGETFDQPIFIHGMVLYMKPAGRVFN